MSFACLRGQDVSNYTHVENRTHLQSPLESIHGVLLMQKVTEVVV